MMIMENKYRVYLADYPMMEEELYTNIPYLYKVQVRKWYGWATIKTFKGEYLNNEYKKAEIEANKLLKILQK